MDARTQIAAMAMQAMITKDVDNELTERAIAYGAVSYADALLERLAKTNPESDNMRRIRIMREMNEH